MNRQERQQERLRRKRMREKASMKEYLVKAKAEKQKRWAVREARLHRQMDIIEMYLAGFTHAYIGKVKGVTGACINNQINEFQKKEFDLDHVMGINVNLGHKALIPAPGLKKKGRDSTPLSP
jgi:hypothetical protein